LRVSKTAIFVKTEQLNVAACVTEAAVCVTQAAGCVTEAAAFVTEAVMMRFMIIASGFP
jgi:hypothetical protein